MHNDIFTGSLVRLAVLDPAADAAVESRWTHDPEFMRLMSADPARPLHVPQIKRKYEKAHEEKNQFHFGLRALEDDRLVGVARLRWIEWSNGAGHMELGIGAPADRGKGFGSDGLRLLLRYAFDELNLHLLTATVFEYNPGALRFLERAGFAVAVRRRQAIHRDGRRWDSLLLALARDEWERRTPNSTLHTSTEGEQE
jgi:RimJ/RimL family protein N-acetyltransferase